MRFEPGAFDEIASPCLLVWPEAVRRNIGRMVEQVDGDMARLRPHVKTHKMADVVRLQMDAGIEKFKCATIAEAEMVAAAGGRDVLLAYQPVGPNIRRLAALMREFPETSFAALVDDHGTLEMISGAFSNGPKPLLLFVDVDCGMRRTGIAAGALEIGRSIEAADGVEFAGLHVYDGHLHQPDLGERRSGFEGALAPVRELIEKLRPPVVVGGGSPTFGLHAVHANWECSPGTTLFWDVGYQERFPDLGMEIAAGLLARVISKPGKDFVCVDLGHKAVGAENPLENRVRFEGPLSNVHFVSQSEEHLVLQTAIADDLAVGQVALGLPFHICPTVALHMEAVLVSEEGVPTGERWKVAARDRRITV